MYILLGGSSLLCTHTSETFRYFAILVQAHIIWDPQMPATEQTYPYLYNIYIYIYKYYNIYIYNIIYIPYI